MVLDVLLVPLTVVGVVGLVCTANMAGPRQRYALAAAATVAGAWIVIAVVARWVMPETSCGLF